MSTKGRFLTSFLCRASRVAHASSQLSFANSRYQNGRIVANSLTKTMCTVRNRRIKVERRVTIVILNVRTMGIFKLRAMFKEDLGRCLVRLARASRI